MEVRRHLIFAGSVVHGPRTQRVAPTQPPRGEHGAFAHAVLLVCLRLFPVRLSFSRERSARECERSAEEARRYLHGVGGAGGLVAARAGQKG